MENMENNTNQPMLCKSNCGFFGNQAYDGYCSKCYKDHVKKQNTGSSAGRLTPTPSTSSTNINNNTSNINGSITISSITTTSSSSTSLSNILKQEQQQQQSVIVKKKEDETTANDKTMSNELHALNKSVSVETTNSIRSKEEREVEGEQLIESNISISSSSSNGEKKKKSRCCAEDCKRKVGLTGFDCRCGGLFCWEHRYSDKHDCKFDYKEMGQDQIRKSNPVVVGEKINKI